MVCAATPLRAEALLALDTTLPRRARAPEVLEPLDRTRLAGVEIGLAAPPTDVLEAVVVGLARIVLALSLDGRGLTVLELTEEVRVEASGRGPVAPDMDVLPVTVVDTRAFLTAGVAVELLFKVGFDAVAPDRAGLGTAPLADGTGGLVLIRGALEGVGSTLGLEATTSAHVGSSHNIYQQRVDSLPNTPDFKTFLTPSIFCPILPSLLKAPLALFSFSFAFPFVDTFALTSSLEGECEGEALTTSQSCFSSTSTGGAGLTISSVGP